MHTSPFGLDEYDAQTLEEDLLALVSDGTAGRTVTYHQFRKTAFHPTGGVATGEPAAVTLRVYRGRESSRKEPGPDVGAQQVIVLKSMLKFEPKAGDWLDDNGQKFAVENVDYGDVGPTRVYYLLDVKAAGT